MKPWDMMRRMPVSSGGDEDPLIDFVTILLNFDGPPDSTTITDEKGGSFSVVGNAKLNGAGACIFDGAGDAVETAGDARTSPGSGVFAVDMWVTVNSSANQIFTARSSYPANVGPFRLDLAGGKLRMLGSTDGNSFQLSAADPDDFPLGVKTHIGMSRDASNVFRLVRDSVVVASQTLSGSMNASTRPVSIGANNSVHGSAYSVNGLIHAYRFTKGAYRDLAGQPDPFPVA